ncbi:hypothetical protein K0A96_00880, partial [Patescibacteria group bacterium]|nr:hypothetical protein [Patescibacteria group bacterium]
ITSGIPAESIFLILSIPFVTLIIIFFRYIIGVRTFSIYEPLIVAYALYFISSDFLVGLKFGIPFIFAIWLVGEIFGRVSRKSRLHHYSIISLKLSLASFFVIGILFAAVYLDKSGFFSINSLPLIIMITLLEAVSVFQAKKGNFEANMLTLQTLFLAVISYLVISTERFSQFLIANYYLVILAVFAIYWVGRYSGLKLSEFIRFKNVLKDE